MLTLVRDASGMSLYCGEKKFSYTLRKCDCKKLGGWTMAASTMQKHHSTVSMSFSLVIRRVLDMDYKKHGNQEDSFLGSNRAHFLCRGKQSQIFCCRKLDVFAHNVVGNGKRGFIFIQK